jgi:DinB superfamily
MPKPQPHEYASFFETYTSKVQANSLQEAVEKYATAIHEFITSMPANKADYAYAAGKWTIKDVIQHLIDVERVFTYRALSFARKDNTPLPGFEEDDWAASANTSNRSLENLQDEFVALRHATDIMLLSFTNNQLQETGTANNNPITVHAIGFIIYGHLLHHIGVLKERYL